MKEQEQLQSPSSLQTKAGVLPKLSFAGSLPEKKKRAQDTETKINVENLNFYYGRAQALHGITLEIPSKQITAFIGPSGCGKSTLLRTINRMNDIIPNTHVEGHVRLDGEDIYAAGTDVVSLRSRIGMVFQKSNPF